MHIFWKYTTKWFSWTSSKIKTSSQSLRKIQSFAPVYNFSYGVHQPKDMRSKKCVHLHNCSSCKGLVYFLFKSFHSVWSLCTFLTYTRLYHIISQHKVIFSTSAIHTSITFQFWRHLCLNDVLLGADCLFAVVFPNCGAFGMSNHFKCYFPSKQIFFLTTETRPLAVVCAILISQVTEIWF